MLMTVTGAESLPDNSDGNADATSVADESRG
jgi:hypothetical protein